MSVQEVKKMKGCSCCVWTDSHRAAVLNSSMFNRAAMHIHEEQEPGWIAMVTTVHTHKHTHGRTHNPKYRIDQWCFHYVTFVYGVKQ